MKKEVLSGFFLLVTEGEVCFAFPYKVKLAQFVSRIHFALNDEPYKQFGPGWGEPFPDQSFAILFTRSTPSGSKKGLNCEFTLSIKMPPSFVFVMF